LIEKFHDWTVPGEVVDPPFHMDDLLTDVMFYWIGGQNPASWFYLWFYAGGGRQLPDNRRVEVPTGLLIAPRDTVLPPPDSVIARAYNVTRRTDTAHGGHFAALEQPDVFVEDVRSYFKEHRPTTDAESAASQS
jgi:microsomal epoxide hydrolase